MTIAEFWNAQRFSYLVTYSFNRGPRLASLHETTITAIKKIKEELQHAPFRDQQKLEYQLRQLKEAIRSSTYNKKLTSGSNKFDSTAERIAVVEKDSAVATQLSNIVHSSTGDAIFFMCPSIYRDALVFYDEHNRPVSVLNICLECSFMETNSGIVVKANMSTYEALYRLLIQLGHPIENDEN